MTVVLSDLVWREWLALVNEDIVALQSRLLPFAATPMHGYSVSPLVNTVRNNSPELLEPGAST
jgi:putative SOS response-associated peptidase YedK